MSVKEQLVAAGVPGPEVEQLVAELGLAGFKLADLPGLLRTLATIGPILKEFLPLLQQFGPLLKQLMDAWVAMTGGTPATPPAPSDPFNS